MLFQPLACPLMHSSLCANLYWWYPKYICPVDRNIICGLLVYYSNIYGILSKIYHHRVKNISSQYDLLSISHGEVWYREDFFYSPQKIVRRHPMFFPTIIEICHTKVSWTWQHLRASKLIFQTLHLGKHFHTQSLSLTIVLF